jgi:intracellular septation protein
MKLLTKLLLEFMPLGLFFIASTEYDIFVGTAILMVATVISLILTWWIFRQIAIMAIITAATGIISGGMTQILQDPMYVKLKPTIVSMIFASILLGGQIMRRPLFKALLGENLHLTDEGWRILTWLWFGYFLFITGLNEYIWRNYSTEFWVAFKAFALMPMTVLYALPQMHFLRHHRTAEAEPFLSKFLSRPKPALPPAGPSPVRQPT